MNRKDLLTQIEIFESTQENLKSVYKQFKELQKEKFELESDEGEFWSKIHLLAQEIAFEHATATYAVRYNEDCAPQDIVVKAVTEISTHSLLINYTLMATHRVVIRYYPATNATVEEYFEKNAY